MLRQKDRRGVADALQAAVGHREDADLVDRAVAVLDRADQAKAGVRIALEVEHRVDDVFEHPRPGQCTLLGHVADQNHGDSRLFGQARQLRGAFAYLGDRSRCRVELIRPQGLDRVDHRHLRLYRLQRGQDFFQVDLGEQAQRPRLQRQAPGAHGDLLARFFAADVEHVSRRRHLGQRLQQQRALADSRVATNQHHSAGDQSTTERPIELADTGRQAVFLAGVDLAERLHRGSAAQRRETSLLTGRRRFGDGLDEGIPDPAAGTLSLPLGGAGAALGTGENGLLPVAGPGHDQPSTTGTRRASAQNSS
ncbi:MAG: hypothetical protein AW12_01756 [Candidatus Accumulibacter sp. BA-94]|nr:MAG: hypothetical protein AW12_01756 [Candidatus Accumulibacter sp. BA-94]